MQSDFLTTLGLQERCPTCGQIHAYTGFIYRTTNLVTGQWYVGSHMGCEDDGYLGSGVRLRRALSTFGEDSFERTVLLRLACDRTYLLETEERLLIRLSASGDPKSYNVKNRGIGQDPAVTSAVFKGRKKSPEQRRKQRESLKASGAVAGVNNPRAQAVIDLQSHDTYAYARLAARAVGGTDAGISEACHKGYSHRGRQWMFLEEWEAAGSPEVHPAVLAGPRRTWPVVCLTDGQVFQTTMEAAKAVGLSHSAVNTARARPGELSAGGHYWMPYVEWAAQGRPTIPFAPYERAIDRVVRLADGDIQPNAERAAGVWGISAVIVHKHCKGELRAQNYMYLTDWEAAGCPIRPRRRARGDPKAVVCLDTGERFPSVSDAARAYGRPTSAVSLAIHQRRSVNGHRLVFANPSHYRSQRNTP